MSIWFPKREAFKYGINKDYNILIPWVFSPNDNIKELPIESQRQFLNGICQQLCLEEEIPYVLIGTSMIQMFVGESEYRQYYPAFKIIEKIKRSPAARPSEIPDFELRDVFYGQDIHKVIDEIEELFKKGDSLREIRKRYPGFYFLARLLEYISFRPCGLHYSMNVPEEVKRVTVTYNKENQKEQLDKALTKIKYQYDRAKENDYIYDLLLRVRQLMVWNQLQLKRIREGELVR